MRGLLFLLLRYSSFTTFLVLKVLSLYLIIQYNQGQNQIFIHSANRITGSLEQTFTNFTNYFNLRQERDELLAENAELKAKLKISRFDEVLDTLFIKSIPEDQQFLYIGAKVVKNQLNSTHNHITINRGSKHGIKSRMGVISKHGLVGIVKNVSTHYAQVMTLLHKQSRISGALKKTNHFGSLQWEGDDFFTLEMTEVPKNIPIAKGDTVVTSGFSSHFPKGLPIGTVDDFFVETGSSFLRVKVRLLNDLYTTSYVYVLDNIHKEELSDLENGNQ